MNLARRHLLQGVAAVSITGGALAACRVPQTQKGTGDDVLGSLDAVGVATLVRNKEITPLEATDAAIARVEAINPQLNFLVTPCYDRARNAARQQAQGLPPGAPFVGVPFLIKDLTALAGVRRTFGSRAFKDDIPKEQPPYVDAMLAAGLIPIGKSSTPEFGFAATTEPLLTGPTRNPWNVDRSSGGSSGGSAAAVAAGAVPIAHGNDGAGSIRIPASCCGVFGFKPSRARGISDGRPDDPHSLGVEHCLSRSVRDSAAWLAAMERRDNVSMPPVGLIAGPSTRRLKIGLAINDALGRRPQPAVREAIEAAAKLCADLKHDVRELRLPFDGPAASRAFILLWANRAREVAGDVAARAPDTPLEDLLDPFTRGLAEMAKTTSPEALTAAGKRLFQTEVEYGAIFPGVDVILTPTLSAPPAPIGAMGPEQEFQKALDFLTAYAPYTPLQNIAGAPAMSVPLFWTAEGLPIGAHFSAAKNDEATLLALAFELEQAQPWLGVRKPGVHAQGSLAVRR